MQTSSRERRVIEGFAASHGVAVGPAKVAGDRGLFSVRRRRLSPDAIRTEVERLRRAIEQSRREIERAREELDASRCGTGDQGTDLGVILDAHLLMHRDELLVDAVIDHVQSEAVNAEWALRSTLDELGERLRRADSRYFRDRAQDLEHVGRNIMRSLVGRRTPVPPMSSPCILIADDLSPADAARLGVLPVLALVTESGSATTHTAILARALGIPAVVGAEGVMEHVADGETVVADALQGRVVVGPSTEECEQAGERGRRHRSFADRLRTQPVVPATTADGTSLELLANLDLPVEAGALREVGAMGVGLYRTEYLYLDRSEPPSEAEQLEVYSKVVRAVAPHPVTFRTCDLGADKVPYAGRPPRVANPAMGLRGVRLSLARPAVLHTQLRALLRSSAEGPLRIMLPLVTSLDEVRSAREMLDRERDRLVAEGVPVGPVQFGIMVEVPSTALLASAFARACDFLSVGTNDLVQYTLAVDRTNAQVAHLASSFDPAVLRLLDEVARATAQTDRPLSMCGDMAADPVALPLVLGLGYRTLSVPLAALPLVRELSSRIDLASAREATQQALSCPDAQQARARVLEAFRSALGELWEEEGLELNS